MQKYNNETMKQGFTLIELLTVVSIIVLLSIIILPNYRSSVSQLTLERSAHKMAQDIRRAAEMAMSAKEWQGQIPSGGYGVHVKFSWQTYYKLYADKNGNEQYDDGADGEVETINLEKGVIIKAISPSSSSINFKPPAPIVKIKSEVGVESNSITITLALEADLTKTRTVRVNKAGLIDVE